MNQVLGFLVVVLFSQTMFAQSYQMGEVQFSGTGCSNQTARAAVTADGSSVSFLFDQFSGELLKGQKSFTTFCKISIPIQVQPGFVVASTEVQYNGFAALDNRASLMVTTTGFDVPNRASGLFRRFGGRTLIQPGTVGNISFAHRAENMIGGKIRCAPQNEISLTVVGTLSGINKFFVSQGQFSLDSADISNVGVRMGLKLVPCLK